MKRLLSLLASSLCLGITITLPVEAQITTDETTNTILNPTGQGMEIKGGDQAQGNLFHSFREFSVPKGTEAYFNNGLDIVNIFSRVTGGNMSQIDGLIRANGTANLFLINPRGIIFGQDAALDIGGSFYGSSADSILFPEGIEFAASNPVTPRLTMNAPIGLRFRENPGEIVNQSVVGLTVKADNNLALIGGDIILAGGNINLSGKGKVELGSIADNNVVNLEPDNSSFKLGYEAVTDWRNITVNQGATIATTEADISLRGNQIALVDGSQIISEVDGSQIGGDIKIKTRELLINNQSNIATVTFGEGNAGNIYVDASDSVKIVGTGFEAFEQIFIERLLSEANPLDIETVLNNGTGTITLTNGTGSSGNTNIISSRLQLQEGGVISGVTFAEGEANNLTIKTTESLEVTGSGIFNSPLVGSTGNGNMLKIDTKDLTVSDGGVISSVILGKGDGGDIIIDASGDINILRALPNSLVPTGIFSNSAFENGKAGDITITTNNLTLEDGGQITSVSGIATREGIIAQGGEGGNIKIFANKSLEIYGNNSNDISRESAIAASTLTENNAGDLTIKTNQIIIANGGTVAVGSQINFNGGNAGILKIIADSIKLKNGATINAATLSGNQGNINITTKNLQLFNQSNIRTDSQNSNGGNITINADLVFAFPNENSDIVANALQGGNGGNITINAEGILGIEPRPSIPANKTNDIDASSEFGLSGNINLNTPDIPIIQADINLSSQVISAETVVADACSAHTHSEVSSLIIQGKGGIPTPPNLPLTAEVWLGDSQETLNSSELNHQETPHKITLQIQPVKTSVGDIYPAKGVLITEDGRVILTAYDTQENIARIPNHLRGCQ